MTYLLPDVLQRTVLVAEAFLNRLICIADGRIAFINVICDPLTSHSLACWISLSCAHVVVVVVVFVVLLS